MSSRKSLQISVLTFIKDSKEVLFGKVSDKLTYEEKLSCWKDVATKARAIGFLKSGQDAKYPRDTTWQNRRKRTMAKRDNQRKTGTEGGEHFKFDEADHIIFDIIGSDSPVLDGMKLPETSGTSDATLTLASDDSQKENLDEPEEPLLKRQKPGPKPGKARYIEELQLKKGEKVQAQLELIKRENRIRDLQILKLEKELGMGPSEFTQQFYSQPLVVEIISSEPADEVVFDQSKQ